MFGNLDPDDSRWSDEDRRVAASMSSYWANFIATGDPNGPGLPDWPGYAPEAGTVMRLGRRFAPEPVADAARLDFWQRFFATQKAW